jgi:hypothetical protein
MHTGGGLQQLQVDHSSVVGLMGGRRVRKNFPSPHTLNMVTEAFLLPCLTTTKLPEHCSYILFTKHMVTGKYLTYLH